MRKAGRQAERRALHHRHALGLEQIVRRSRSSLPITLPSGVVLPIMPAQRRIDVERALRPRAVQALGLVQHRHDQVAALLEHRGVLGDEVLRPVQRRHRRRLADRRGLEVICDCTVAIALISAAGRPRSRSASRSCSRPSTRRSWSACGRRAAARPGRCVANSKSSKTRCSYMSSVRIQTCGCFSSTSASAFSSASRVGGAGRVRRRVQDQPLGPGRDRRARAPRAAA